MSVWSQLSRLLTVDDTIIDEDFSLIGDDEGEDGDQAQEDAQQDRPHKKKSQPRSQTSDQESKQKTDQKTEQKSEQQAESEPPMERTKRGFVKPRKIGAQARQQEPKEKAEVPAPAARKSKVKLQQKKRQQPAPAKETVQPPQKKPDHQVKVPDQVPDELSANLSVNRAMVENIFFLPQNADVIIRDFTITSDTPIKAIAVFLEGMSDKTIINNNILEPLMLFSGLPAHDTTRTRVQMVKERLLPGNQIMEFGKWDDVKNGILSGSTALFLDGADKALLMETKGWEHRGVSDTKTETVVRGPHDAFNENLRTNTGLVRSRFRSERLITEMMQVGVLAPTDIAIMYVQGLTNKKLVGEIRRRIQAIDIDFLQDSGTLEQLIEESRKSFIPKMMATERPDRVAAFLSEGFVAIFVGHSPYVLIAPSLLFSMLHTAEDVYIAFPFGTFIRIIRFVAFVIAILLPGTYIAVTNYHPEMIPTDLMLTIASARERVPFPAVVEVLLMELALELIREAGIRIPNVIGPTIGIVGALILGQAAVEAGVVSPLLVIVVAVTALAAFTMPNYNMSFAVRTLRFVFIFAAAGWGFYGITLAIMVTLMHWATLKSFGVPILSPLAPRQKASMDVILRGPVYRNEVRPVSLRPQDAVRQEKIIRKWAPEVRDSAEAKHKMLEDMKQPTLSPRNDVQVEPKFREGGDTDD
ncbi:spore germination protein [Tumebacillus avium]|uniref:Spore germination protein n=1 Tax=Tumebacillus avium TaxID=1903704 RepID=A0A1Y0IP34_9BACL|nr:spore germination protein [Tumebacillus avium]ARU62352.1 spore germination protein [Tumebacillus avium]